MSVVLSHGERRIEPAYVRALYDDAHWWPERSLEDVDAVLDDLCFGAWEGDRLIGFARVVTDGRLRAFVEDVVVASGHRRLGNATALLEKIVGSLPDVETVSLFCAPELVQLYLSADFRPQPRDVVMHRKRP